jgi:ribosome-dependent ATPase
LTNVADISNLSHSYGDSLALDDVTLSIPAHRRVGFLGPDAVGKSTLLGLIAGVRKLQTGELTVLDGSMKTRRHRRRVCPRIAYMPQGLGRNLYMSLSVFENIDFFGRLFGLSSQERKQRIDELLQGTGLTPFAKRPAGNLSGGMKQKLGLCCALIHDPDLLILDEPTTGVDPLSRQQFWQLIDMLQERHRSMSVLVATAYMSEAEDFDWLVAMDDGHILATGSPAQLKSDTGTDNLDDAFINLLPVAKQGGHKTLVVPAREDRSSLPVAISAQGLTKRFGNFTAVDNVNFEIRQGEIFGFLGSNGCGKTTTMKMLTGLLPASEGKAMLFGETTNSHDLAIRNRVGYMSQSFSLYGELTVRQNLLLHAQLFHLPDKEIPPRIEELVDTFGLINYIDEQTSQLPLGIRQRLSLAVAVVHKPEMLILDEPTSGVDPVARDWFWELLVSLSRKQSVTIFISTHYMNEAERCDRISFMHAGKVLATDSPAALISSTKSENLEQAFIRYLQSTVTENNHTLDVKQAIAEKDPARYRGFSLTRLAAYFRRETMELLRDPIRLAFALLGPLLLLVVFGYGISFDVEKLPYAVLDRDQSPDSRFYLENFSGSRYFQRRPPLHNHQELEKRMRSGELRMAIEIPPDFGKHLRSGRQPTVGIWVDGAIPFRAETSRGYVFGVHQAYLADLARRYVGRHIPGPAVNIEPRFRYNQAFKSVYAMVPGIVMLLLMLIPAMMTAVGVVREKELGSITNLYATPVTRIEFLLGKQLPYVVVAMISFFSLLGMANVLFGVPVKGSMFALTLGALLYVITTTGFGMLISAFVKTQIAAIFAAAIFTMIPSINFTGFFVPVSSLTGGAKTIAHVFSGTYFQKISIGTFTKALGIGDLIPYYALLLLIIIVVVTVSLVLIRTQET